MANLAKNTTATIVLSLRYRDAPAAIEWLCEAFGFEKHFVVPGEDGTIAHAQLVFGNGMIMLGSARDDEFGELQKPLETPDSPVSKSAYVIVDDVDAHHARAVAAGGAGGHDAGGSGLWRAPLRLPRPRGQSLELRQLRSLGVTPRGRMCRCRRRENGSSIHDLPVSIVRAVNGGGTTSC